MKSDRQQRLVRDLGIERRRQENVAQQTMRSASTSDAPRASTSREPASASVGPRFGTGRNVQEPAVSSSSGSGPNIIDLRSCRQAAVRQRFSLGEDWHVERGEVSFQIKESGVQSSYEALVIQKNTSVNGNGRKPLSLKMPQRVIASLRDALSSLMSASANALQNRRLEPSCRLQRSLPVSFVHLNL